MHASLVIPTLNEERSIVHVLDTFHSAVAADERNVAPADRIEWEILVVDGLSTDRTAEEARAHGARVIAEPRRGYGRAYRTGFAAASGEVIATSDGDATYPVEAIPELVHRLGREHLDFITGNRLAYLAPRAMSTEHRIGNRVLNLTTGLLYHRWVTRLPGAVLHDSQSGLWVFRKQILDRLRLTQSGMQLSEEIKIEVLIHGLRAIEVPIHYRERWGAPKLSSWRDGMANLRFLVAKRVQLERELRGEPPDAAHA